MLHARRAHRATPPAASRAATALAQIYHNTPTHRTLARPNSSAHNARAPADTPPPPYSSPDKQSRGPRHFCELTGETLFLLAKQPGETQHPAARELLRREIIAVDRISYAEAGERIRQIASFERDATRLLRAPYYIGMGVVQSGGWLAVPLVFSYTMATHFNDNFVLAEAAEAHETETILEVGMWTWGWMEPPLGTFSFFLLCMQWGAQQRSNLGIKPFTERLKSLRADRVAAAFPQYDRFILRDYAKATTFNMSDSDGIQHEPPWVKGPEDGAGGARN